MGLQINRQQPKRRRCGNGSTPQVRKGAQAVAVSGAAAAPEGAGLRSL